MRNSLPLILNKISPPKFFETLSNGDSKLECWERSCLLLSLSGLLPLSDKVNTIRVDDHTLKITTTNSKMIKINFKDLVLFDDENVYGLDIRGDKSTYVVLDWFDVRTGGKHQIQTLHTDDDFVSDVYFYPTGRMSGRHQNKDLVAVSHMTKQQLNDVEYSDLYVKYKVLKMMSDAGIKGARNGRDVNNPHKYKYYSLKIESSKREIIEVRKNRRVHCTKNVEFLDLNCEETLEDWLAGSTNNYCKKMSSMI